MKRALVHSVRKVTRKAGFDIVQYLPQDFEPADIEVLRKVSPYTMTSAERIYSLRKAVQYVTNAKIPGCIVECGVWKGGSMMTVALTLQECADASRELFLFDTFQGMSEPTEKDISSHGEDAAVKWSASKIDQEKNTWCLGTLDEVRRAMKLTGYDENKVHYIKGKVEQTIPEHAPDEIALLRLDTDWYESTRHELEHLFPRLAKHGVLIIDDYGEWQGARQAVDEYFAKHNVNMLLNRIDSTGRIGTKLT